MEYKVLTQKDRFLGNKFNPEKLEQALNAYAEEGWIVVSAVAADFPGFGGRRNELIVVLERKKINAAR